MTDDGTRSTRQSNPTERSNPSELPIVDLDDFDDKPGDSAARRPAVAGIVLAAGTSSRFGPENKLLATVDGESIVRHAVRTLLESPVDPVVVVLGHEADRVRQALDGLDVETVLNERYETGQASSVRTGIVALGERDGGAGDTSHEAALVALGDMPFVAPSTVETILDAYARGVGDAIAPAFEGVRGNPVVFDRRFFEALADVDGDVGGREILLENETSALVAVDDPGVRRDVDRPSDVDRPDEL